MNFKLATTNKELAAILGIDLLSRQVIGFTLRARTGETPTLTVHERLSGLQETSVKKYALVELNQDAISGHDRRNTQLEGLRDKFALAVLPAIYAELNGDSRYEWEQMAVRAYQLADAAMKARKSQVNQ